MQSAENLIKNVKTERNFSFSRHTTYGLGGKAEIAYFPANIEEAIAVFDYVNFAYDNYVILGNGSNVLASDSYFNGAVISTKNLNGICANDGILKCMSGTTVGAMLNYCKSANLGGLEYLAGIPASIGGIVYMNGGVNSHHICDNVENVLIYDGELRNFSNKNCNFGNKHSTMRDISALILRVDMRVSACTSNKIDEKINFYLENRKKLPRGKSCGCVFKNAEGISSGKLIDETGLKGLSCGNAYVSPEHANFIINNGASAYEVYLLISEVKRRVFEKFGIKLQEEVVYIGEFNEINS